MFWIHNTGPVGCLPYSYIYYEPKKGNLDANGCVIPHNEIAQEFNRKLKDQVFQLRRKFPQARFTYVDVYRAKYELISNARSQGDLSFKSPKAHIIEWNAMFLEWITNLIPEIIGHSQFSPWKY